MACVVCGSLVVPGMHFELFVVWCIAVLNVRRFAVPNAAHCAPPCLLVSGLETVWNVLLAV